jgi:hypothetical protein
MSVHIIQGTSAPSVAPTKIGQHYIDITNRKSYVSVGTSSASDWIDSGGSFQGTPYFEYILTGSDLSAGQMTLPETPPISSDVSVNIYGGCAQANGIDFTVSGNILSWSGLGMATVVSAGDILIIEF